MKKIGITYWMQKKNETAESYINLPVSENMRYKYAYHTYLKAALEAIAKLQGYTLIDYENEPWDDAKEIPSQTNDFKEVK